MRTTLCLPTWPSVSCSIFFPCLTNAIAGVPHTGGSLLEAACCPSNSPSDLHRALSKLEANATTRCRAGREWNKAQAWNTFCSRQEESGGRASEPLMRHRARRHMKLAPLGVHVERGCCFSHPHTFFKEYIHDSATKNLYRPDDPERRFRCGMGEEAVKPVLHDHPRLQWFNGLSTTTMEMAVGWHIEADVNPQLDEVAASLGLKHYVVQHKTTAQNGEAKQLPYWALNFGQRPVSLIVISLGLQSKRQMNKTEDRVGIAYGWETVRDSQGAIVYKPGTAEPKKQCKLQFRAFVHELVEAGFDEWLQVGITGYLTDCMLEALNDHFRTLEAYSALTEQEAGERRRAPFFGFSLPLVPGPVKMVGPQNGEKSPIYPMVARIPQQIERSFVAEHLVPSALIARIRDGLLDEALLWSMERSIEMNQGKAQPEDGEVVEGVVSASVVVEEAPASLASRSEEHTS